jgi:hypothetical protein
MHGRPKGVDSESDGPAIDTAPPPTYPPEWGENVVPTLPIFSTKPAPPLYWDVVFRDSLGVLVVPA